MKRMMKGIIPVGGTLLLAWSVWAAEATSAKESTRLSPNEVHPQEHYGSIARRVVTMLPKYHVLQKDCDDAVSQQAWTNLLNAYDFNHSVFLAEDIKAFEPMQLRIDDALRAGDVSFAYEVYRVFCRRVTECMTYATNLLETATFDFNVDETYQWKRKDEPWPADDVARKEIWRKRMKNEYLAQELGRVLDKEQEARDAKKAKKSDKKGSVSYKAGEFAATNETDEVKEPELSVKDNLLKRYRQYLNVITEPDEEVVLQRYLSAVAQAYDPHSDYMSPERKEDFDMGMSLSLCGVGATLQMDDGALKIVDIVPGGPIDRDKRIKKGDKIIGVGQGDGPIEDILYKPMRKTISKIRGPKDTKVVLEILPRTDPSGATRKRIALIRDVIKLEDQAATGRIERVTLNGVTNVLGYVRLPEFYGTMDRQPGAPGFRSCSLDVAKYVANFNAENTDGMILDLRGNGGGSLKEAVMLSAVFMRPSPVVQIRELYQIGVLRIFDDQPCLAYRKPLVVLIDRASASASEIVAGALQDTGRAIIIGDKCSHGKGTVQTIMPVGPETFGSMKITTARFYRINGSSTQVQGVMSDLHLPSILDELDIGEDKLPNALPHTRVEPLVYQNIWDLGRWVPELKVRSDARLEKLPAYRKHMKAVASFRESSERTILPLEREKRLALMREERAMRKLEEADDPDAEDAEDAAYLQSGKNTKKDDIVLEESFRILSDLVLLTHGTEVPKPPESKIPAWMRALSR